MNHFITTLLFITVLFSSNALHAQIPYDPDILTTRHQQVTELNWVLQNDHDGVIVYNREVKDSGIREVLAFTEIKLPAVVLFKTISDYAHYKDFMPYVQKSEVLPSIHDQKIRVYQKLVFPWPISNRYYTIELTPDTTQAHLGHYAVSWTLSNEEMAEEKGVQLQINDGYWRFCAAADNLTFVEYYIHTDPGGLLPQWAVNQANTQAVIEVIQALQKRATLDASSR